MDEDRQQTWQMRVHGRVQGVGFRDGCERHARQLGLTGWVRNRLDGSVELLAQGEADTLARLRDWLHHGVAAARVDRVEVTARDDAPRQTGFERRPTA